ncbi:hypothetical protein EMU01_07580 [Enterococcus mundtii]|uniref:Uncharacterized protein n=1 Tax=Enterococcus mundtii TaxID=53346 RepID=A0ABQ0VAZ6_ENTMU|nr:hypothetical protein EMU01_07580 [Enterococcus mundtii]GEN17161.1 hypothetical protein LAC02_04420 [Ligilactobacillus acidipiscis]
MGDIIVHVVLVLKLLFWFMTFIGIALSIVYLVKKLKNKF